VVAIEESYEKYLLIKESLFEVLSTVDRSLEEPLGKESAMTVFLEEFKDFFRNLKQQLSQEQFRQILDAAPQPEEEKVTEDT
jgi:dsDNA-binding SOS-regulon protein